jgi:TPP-dependent pyruvate/acetoin dehydrogenase alpha subunit
MAQATRRSKSKRIPHGLEVDQLLEMYRYIRLTRSLEERLVNLHRQSKVVGGLFRSLGQEGESVASSFALRRRTDGTGDMLSPLIRNLGSMLVMGATPVEVIRQYMAKGDSPARGKELNIHFTDYDRGFIGQISPLGDLIPVMAGVTLTFKQRGEDRVGMVYLGDGATSTGAFHEGINFAAVQRCPLVVIVENNHYAYTTPTRLQTAAAPSWTRRPGTAWPAHRWTATTCWPCTARRARRSIARAPARASP